MLTVWMKIKMQCGHVIRDSLHFPMFRFTCLGKCKLMWHVRSTEKIKTKNIFVRSVWKGMFWCLRETKRPWNLETRLLILILNEYFPVSPDVHFSIPHWPLILSRMQLVQQLVQLWSQWPLCVFVPLCLCAEHQTHSSETCFSSRLQMITLDFDYIKYSFWTCSPTQHQHLLCA